MEYARKFGMVVTTNKRSCSINNGCRGYHATPFLSVKIEKNTILLILAVSSERKEIF